MPVIAWQHTAVAACVVLVCVYASPMKWDLVGSMAVAVMAAYGFDRPRRLLWVVPLLVAFAFAFLADSLPVRPNTFGRAFMFGAIGGISARRKRESAVDLSELLR